MRMSVRERHVIIWAAYMVVTLTAGTTFYDRVEGLSKTDAFYFSVITVTTVGYGDIHPVTHIGKIFTAIYALVGQGLLISLLAIIHSKRNQKRNFKIPSKICSSDIVAIRPDSV